MWTCVNILQLQRGTSQTNRVLSLHISLNTITGLAKVHLQVLSIYNYNFLILERSCTEHKIGTQVPS